MSVKSNPETTSQAEASNISETTKREDKGQNRSVSTWFDRFDANSTYLVGLDRVWSYGETAAEIEARSRTGVVSVAPALDPESVFDILAGLFGGGAMVGEGVSGDPRGAALVVATSGTTGTPRGVRLSMANLEAAARSSAAHLGNGASDRWLLAMPLTHVAGLSILVRQAWTGGSVLLLPRFSEDAVWSAIGAGVTMVSVVPTMLHRLLDSGAAPAHKLRTVLVGGGPIPAGLLERAHDAGLPVRPTYGMTETFGQVATLRPGAPLAYRAHPLPDVAVRIEPDGRLAVRGPQVSAGYLGEPDRPDDWYVTGDLAELDDEGAVIIRGRADTMIITGGENVPPERVEVELAEHPGVLEAVVVGLPDPEWGQKVGCLYSGQPTEGELAGWLRSRVPSHMVPKTWMKVRSVPRTILGKVDRPGALAALSREAG